MLPLTLVPKTKVPPTLGAGDAVTAKSLPAVLSSLSSLSREKTGNDGRNAGDDQELVNLCEF